MESLISIHSLGAQVELDEGRYRIDVIGGWGVTLGLFSVTLTNHETVIPSKRAFWPVQHYAHGKRAKRVLIVDIPKKDVYHIDFNRPETLQVNHHNLPFFPIMERTVPNQGLKIRITRQFFTFF